MIWYSGAMKLNADICYRALETRDARFDGQFFTAVRTTRVYCRPVCAAPTPKRENCSFYRSAAAAHLAGYRPCLRCRPELAPEIVTQQGADGIVSRMLRLLAEGLFDDYSVADVAQRLAVSERHLRRICVDQLGASPIKIVQTRRLLFARQLLDQTNLPLSEVALAAGFGSIRRFNAVFQNIYQRTPRDIRRNREPELAHTPASGITLKLAFNPPYQWDSLMAFFAQRALPSVEAVSPKRYCRTIALNGSHGLIEVRPALEQQQLLATIWFAQVDALSQIVQRLRRLFDLGAVPTVISEHLSQDALLAPLVAALPGLRLPGAWDSFELAVRAILGQQISVAGARTLAARLVEAFGDPFELEGVPAAAGLRRVFPAPQTLVAADLATIGLPKARAAAIRTLAAAVCDDPHFLCMDKDLDTFVERLCRLAGIGPWTANYIALRGLGEPDALLATDLGVKQAMQRLGASGSPADTLARAEAWRPWRAYANFYLWQQP